MTLSRLVDEVRKWRYFTSCFFSITHGDAGKAENRRFNGENGGFCKNVLIQSSSEGKTYILMYKKGGVKFDVNGLLTNNFVLYDDGFATLSLFFS